MKKLLAALLAMRLALAPALCGDDYVIDKARSQATFELRYLLGSIAGTMRDISGTIRLNARHPTQSSVQFSIKTASLDTGSDQLDRWLGSADFLDVATFPHIVFRSRSITAAAKANVYHVVGDLTLRGVTKPVMLSVDVAGALQDQAGRARATFTVRTSLNRKDYGITWNKALDQDALLVGNDVEVTVHLEAQRQAP